MSESVTDTIERDPLSPGDDQQGSLADRGQRSADGAAGVDTSDKTASQPTDLDALKETPFTKVGDIVTAYKGLQRQLAGRTPASAGRLDPNTAALVQMLATQMGQQQGGKKEPVDPNVFLRKLLEDPVGTLSAQIQAAVTAESRRLETKYDSRFTETARESAVEKFVAGKGKELTPVQQERFLAIVDANPGLANLPNALDLYLGLLIAEDPSGYAKARTDNDASRTAASEAKDAAGAVGGKRTSVSSNQQGGKKKDEFDAVLDLFDSETASARRSEAQPFRAKNPRNS